MFHQETAKAECYYHQMPKAVQADTKRPYLALRIGVGNAQETAGYCDRWPVIQHGFCNNQQAVPIRLLGFGLDRLRERFAS